MNRIYGEYLGYPPCCIKEFGDVAIPAFMKPAITVEMAVNGFLPCPACAQCLKDGEVTYDELINPNRMCTIPFVLRPTQGQDKQIGIELRAL